MSKSKSIELSDANQNHLLSPNRGRKNEVFPPNSSNSETIDQHIEMISKSGRESTESIKNNDGISKLKKKKCEDLLNESRKSDSIPVVDISPNDDSMDGDNRKNNSDNMQRNPTVPIDVNHSSSSSETMEQKSSDKCRFEEVEIKLEEMFAGIEDEQSTHHINLPTENISKTVTNNIDNGSKDILPVKLPEKTLQTKAAVKSTECVMPTYPLDPKTSVEIDKKYTFMKNVQPRRRLSVGLEHSSRRMAEKQADLHTKETNVSKTEFMVPNDNNSEVIGKDNTNKKKPCANNKKLNESKRDNNSNSKIKKKKTGKAEEQYPLPMKSRQQKFKNRRVNNFSSSSENNEPEERIQQTKDMETKYRSPFIVIKSDGAVSIVNTVTADDCNDKNSKVKKYGIYVPERKNLKGIYSSTLSTKYDADTADSTWICVFCKHGPHKKGLGDLFGPYAVSTDCDEYRMTVNMYIPEINKRRKMNVHSENSSVMTCHPRQSTHETIMQQLLYGHLNLDEDEKSPHQISPLKIPKISPNNFEIWFHEDCAVWAPNLFLVGSRLVGLDSAIWNSARHKCVICEKTGAIICCLRRDCKETAHLVCARENTWLLDDTKLWAYCAKHAVK